MNIKYIIIMVFAASTLSGCFSSPATHEDWKNINYVKVACPAGQPHSEGCKPETADTLAATSRSRGGRSR